MAVVAKKSGEGNGDDVRGHREGIREHNGDDGGDVEKNDSDLEAGRKRSAI